MRTALAVLALAALGAGGCAEKAEPAPPKAAHLPEPTPVVTVTMTEYRFDHGPTVPSGRVVFRMRNAGRLYHRVTLLPLPDDLPPIAEQLAGSERRFLDPFAGIGDHKPGASRSFAVDLEAGRRYAMICYTVDRDEKSHAAKGMSTEFRTAGSAIPPEDGSAKP